MRFAGKVALVTGAGKNIGAAIARAFGAEGAAVAVVDIDSSSAEETARKIKADGGSAFAWTLDVGDASAVAEIVSQVQRHFGTIHSLVNNAALVTRTSDTITTILETSEEIWDQFFRVNVKGAFLMSREVSRIMIRSEVRGRIVNITSVAAESARIGAGHYCCSKAALAMFTRVLALELAPHGITVNAVSPGFIQVPQSGPVTAARKEYMEAFLKGVPVNRHGRP
ncbi:MAG: SDR family oxidoreductase, partial [Deltaproteobacteria bacterium]|nr:SDR family oxidoreductase [Deltaproteobacteria bacterium]